MDVAVNRKTPFGRHRLLVALALITYLPGLSLWLPRLLGP